MKRRFFISSSAAAIFAGFTDARAQSCGGNISTSPIGILKSGDSTVAAITKEGPSESFLVFSNPKIYPDGLIGFYISSPDKDPEHAGMLWFGGRIENSSYINPSYMFNVWGDSMGIPKCKHGRPPTPEQVNNSQGEATRLFRLPEVKRAWISILKQSYLDKPTFTAAALG